MLTQSPGRSRSGFTLIELLIVVTVILTLMAIAIPNLLRARASANETVAVASLRSVTTAQVTYLQAYNQGYAPSLVALGPGGGGFPTAAAAALIDPVLATGSKTGYIYTYSAVDANGDGQIDSYTLNADPIVPGQTGSKYFFVDTSNVIRFSLAGPANSTSSPIPPG